MGHGRSWISSKQNYEPLKGFKYEGVVIYVLEKMIPGVTCRMD
jgi:hypothetical protein